MAYSERLNNMATKPSRTLHAHFVDTETNSVVQCSYIAYIIEPRYTIDSKITLDQCHHIGLFNRSSDGETLQLHIGECPSDVAQCIPALIILMGCACVEQLARFECARIPKREPVKTQERTTGAIH